MNMVANKNESFEKNFGTVLKSNESENTYVINFEGVYLPKVSTFSENKPHTEIFCGEVGQFIVNLEFEGDITSEEFVQAVYNKFESDIRDCFYVREGFKSIYVNMLTSILYKKLSDNFHLNNYTEVGKLNINLNAIYTKFKEIKERILLEHKEKLAKSVELSDDVKLLADYYKGEISAQDLEEQGKGYLLSIVKEIQYNIKDVVEFEVEPLSFVRHKIDTVGMKEQVDFVFDVTFISVYSLLLDNININSEEMFTGDLSHKLSEYLFKTLTDLK